MWEQIRDWFESLELRERWMVSAGGVSVAAALLYLLAIEPYMEWRGNLQRQVQEDRNLVAWMESAAAEIRGLEGRQDPAQAGRGGSLFAIVDRTAKEAQLGRAVRQITPDGDAALRVRMERARFDHTLQWLDRLEREHGIRVNRVTLDRGEVPGTVNASLTLERGG
jgi:general secretion pathway protein M